MSSSDRSRYLLDEGDVVVIERPDTAELAFDPNQPRDEDGKWTNDAGQTIAEVGRTIPEERAADAVLEEWMSSPEEFAAARALAAEKARNVPKPTAEQIEKNRKMLEKSKRPGGWGRGNSYTRRERGQALFEEFGGTPGGSCPCAHCGIKVSPRGEGGFAAMTQDKILTAAEGGTYGTAKSGFPNLIPACGGCNASRNQASFDVRPDWDDALAASAELAFDPSQPRDENGRWTTLYRGEGAHDQPSFYPSTGPDALTGAWWTDDAAKAANYAGRDGDVYEIDVKEGEFEPRGARGNYVILDPNVRARRRLRAKGLAASAGATVSDRFVAQSATGKPVGWDTWLEPEVGDRQVTGEYIVRTVDVWFGPYEQHLIAGETCDPATIKIEVDTSQMGVQVFHLQGQHNQADHGNRATATIAPTTVARIEAGETITVPRWQAAEVIDEFRGRDEPIDLTAIDVEGFPQLFAGARANLTNREDMPQVPRAHLEGFRRELEEQGIAVRETAVSPIELRATQRELDGVATAEIAQRIRTGEFDTSHRPWISQDGKVLDGHHRWAGAAVVELEGHPSAGPMEVIQVDMDMDALLVKAREYNDVHGIDARRHGETRTRLAARMVALGFDPRQPRDDGGRWTSSGDVDADGMIDDYQGGHRPTETGPRIHDLLESEMTDGLDVYQNPQFFTGYAKAELDETMAQLRRVQGDPEANVTIYRAAPEGATINEGDWVSLSKTYVELHAESGNAGDTPTILEMEVPAKSVRWAVDDLMEYGYFPDLADKRIFSEDDLAVAMFTFGGLDVDEFGISATFHLQGQHDQQTHAGGRSSAASRRGWKPLEAGIETDRLIEYDEYENQYRVTAANGKQIEARVYTYNTETAAITRTPQWKQRIADTLNGATDGYDMAPTDQPPHIIVQDELPFGLPPEAEEAIAFVVVNGTPGPIPNGAPFDATQIRSNGITINVTPRGREMWDIMEERGRDIMMPSVASTSIARYTGIHEYGHTRAVDDGLSFLNELYDNIRPLSLSSISPEWKELSRYGKVNQAEAHAETFADWVLTGGRSDNAATRYYAEWVFDRAEVLEPLAAAAGATKLRDQWVYCFDGPNGGILVTKASDGVQFHLQGQHDQSTHGNRDGAGGGLPAEFAEAPVGYTETAQAEWSAGAAYLAENEMPDWWLGLDYIDEDGLPVGRDQVGHDWSAEDINDKLEAFQNEVGPEVASGVWMIGRAADSRRKEAIAEAISMNRISVEDADGRYGRDAEADRGEWLDLPPTLYHATSALGAISADGSLKTRREIGGTNAAAGLGGGTDNTISFTSDRKIAEDIARSLHEVHRALNLPKDEFISELKERSGDWWTNVEEMDRNVNGVSSWETTEERYNLYRVFAGERERRDGVLDPLFFGVNPDTLRDMNPADIGIVEVAPAVEGAKGYQVSALGEWRTPTGAATEITQFIEVDDPGQFSLAITALAVEVFRFDPGQPRDENGRWTSTAGSPAAPADSPSPGPEGTDGTEGAFAPITAAEKRGNSRPVSNDEFQRLAAIGRAQLDELAANSTPIEALDASWDSIQERAFGEAQKSWGGATIDSHTGEFLPDGADKFALTVKDPGFETLSVPEGASRDEFMTAMTAAKEKFRPILERQDHYLGVFHDDDLGRIDFDPVTVVDTLDKVETIGAATRAIGGAYNFADGNGYWPPHVDEDAVVASASMGSMGDEITKFKGPAEWKRQAKQLEGAPDAPPAPKKTRKFRAPRD